MNTKVKKKQIIVSVIVILIAISSLLGYKSFIKYKNKQEGVKEYNLIIRDDKNTYKKEYKFTTKQDVLGKALDEQNIIKTDNNELSRLVTEVDKIKADSTKQEWWNLKVNGENSLTGIDDTYIKDKDKVEFVLTVGW